MPWHWLQHKWRSNLRNKLIAQQMFNCMNWLKQTTWLKSSCFWPIFQLLKEFTSDSLPSVFSEGTLNQKWTTYRHWKKLSRIMATISTLTHQGSWQTVWIYWIVRGILSSTNWLESWRPDAWMRRHIFAVLTTMYSNSITTVLPQISIHISPHRSEDTLTSWSIDYFRQQST